MHDQFRVFWIEFDDERFIDVLKEATLDFNHYEWKLLKVAEFKFTDNDKGRILYF